LNRRLRAALFGFRAEMTARQSHETRRSLSADQLARYRRDGVVFPISALSGSELVFLRRTLDELEGLLGGKNIYGRLSQPHLHFRWAYDLATHPKVLDAVEDIIGPDILVHSSTVFCKEGHSPGYVSWHQDGYYWKLSEAKLTSSWIALTDSTTENGCLRAVTGSHGSVVAHSEHKTADNMLTTGLRLVGDVSQSQILDVTLKAGEMSLHHVNLVHGSAPNHSGTRRLGYAVRYLAPSVRQTRKHHAVVIARGEDRYGHFEPLRGVPSKDLEEGISASAHFGQVFSVS